MHRTCLKPWSRRGAQQCNQCPWLVGGVSVTVRTVPDTRPTAILARLLADDITVVSLAARLCAVCVDRLGITGAGLALMSDGVPSGTIAVTDVPAARLEELQFTLGEGPCVDAARAARPVLYPDLAASAAHSRWPGFAAEALLAGVSAVFAFPLQVGEVRIGVLDLYRDSAGPLSAEDLAVALDYADAATMLLLYLQERSGGEQPQLLAAAFDDRAGVHQAAGVLTVQLGIGLAEALVLLRAASYAGGRSVSAVAADVIARRLRMTL